MLKVNIKIFLFNFAIVLLIFLLDRASKIYVLSLAELGNTVDIYLTSYLNIYLIWNKGIAFGLLSFDKNLIYNTITVVIILVTALIFFMILKANGLQKYSLLCILSGSLGNLFDRVYFSAVPDFIDFHIYGYHWFIFNVADIFISLGVICLIFAEMFVNKEIDD
tara:strand:+ start:97 stop:588 length:492 start_codon:yes stop_codon:yes gene_type:complete